MKGTPMRIRRSLLLASMAIAIVAAAPALASGAEVKMGGAQEKNAVITATGTIGFNTLGSWFQCTAHGQINGEGSATTGRVTTFQITTNTCEGAGIFEKCTLSEHDFTKENGTTTSGATKDNPEWTAHVEGPVGAAFLKITNVKIHNFFTGPECEVAHVFLDFSTNGIKLTPSTQTNITAVTVSGIGGEEFNTNSSPFESEAYSGSETSPPGRGSVPLTGASSGTYSLG
jgi:hypothetical protein